MTADTIATLKAACTEVGLDASPAELIRAGENHLYRLPDQIVARITRTGQLDAARKEVRVSRWLASAGIPVVEAIADLPQPIEVNARAVTFWRELPAHRKGTYVELADLLRRLHAVAAPDFELPRLAPFVRLGERLAEAIALPQDDRAWLLQRLANLKQRYETPPRGRAWCAIHGDAWVGNVAVTAEGPVLLDLERFAFGPPEWDLTAVGVSYTTFGSLSAADWAHFCQRYGYDVTTWAGYELFRDIRELRKVSFAWQLAPDRAEITDQARYRLECLQGQHGPRPWGWTGVP